MNPHGLWLSQSGCDRYVKITEMFTKYQIVTKLDDGF